MKQSKKVMIVDDSMIMRHMIKKYISGENVEIVGTAENGRIALDLFKQTNPDIVTLDITMRNNLRNMPQFLAMVLPEISMWN